MSLAISGPPFELARAPELPAPAIEPRFMPWCAPLMPGESPQGLLLGPLLAVASGCRGIYLSGRGLHGGVITLLLRYPFAIRGSTGTANRLEHWVVRSLLGITVLIPMGFCCRAPLPLDWCVAALVAPCPAAPVPLLMGWAAQLAVVVQWPPGSLAGRAGRWASGRLSLVGSPSAMAGWPSPAWGCTGTGVLIARPRFPRGR